MSAPHTLRRLRAALALVGSLVASSAAAQTSAAPATPAADGVPADDRVMLAEATRLMREVGDGVWEGWRSAPHTMILVTPERELLLWYPRDSASGFTKVGYDSVLATEVHVRPRVFPTGMQATFPAVDGVSTIVLGERTLTQQSPAAWVLTVMHEHFHQWQNTQGDYYARVRALQLAGSDSSGMWMLNYPFPYKSDAVVNAFRATLSAARKAAAGPNAGARANAKVRDAWAKLEKSLSPADARYMAFQLWQEGIARYTELAVARRAAESAPPSAEFIALAGQAPYVAEIDRLERHILMADVDLSSMQREAFYPFGAALGLYLDRTAPAWRARYLDAMPKLADLDPARWTVTTRE